MKPVSIWDVPTRLFHWILVALFVFSWWSAENGQMDWHRLSGSAVLGLLVFRVVWGIIGARTARFSSFLRGPGAVLKYLKSDSTEPPAGHNPLGGYSVLAMLLALLTQVCTGLFAVDVDGIESGPLSFLVSFEAGRAAAEIHDISFNILLALIGLHLLAIAYYSIVRRQPLIRHMITGGEEMVAESQISSPARFLLAAILASALAWGAHHGFGL